MLLHIRQFLVQQNTEVTSNTDWLMVAKTTVSERSMSETLGNPKTREKMPFFETRCMSAYYVHDQLITLHKFLVWSLGL